MIKNDIRKMLKINVHMLLLHLCTRQCGTLHRVIADASDIKLQLKIANLISLYISAFSISISQSQN